MSMLPSAVLAGMFAWLAAAPAPLSGSDQRVNCDPNSPQIETSLAIDPADPQHLVAAAIDLSSGIQSIGWYTSFDGGNTWSCGQLLVEPGFFGAADPVVFFDVVGGVHLASLQAFGPGGMGIYLDHSSDGGLSFPQRTLVNLHTDNDKPQVTVNRAPGPGFGDIALGWSRFTFGPPDRIRALVAISSDNAQSFGSPVRVNQRNAQGNRNAFASTLRYGPAGILHVVWPDEGTKLLMHDLSLDGGATFGTDTIVGPYATVPNPLPGPFSFDLKPVFSLDVDTSGGPFDGNVYIAYHTWLPGPPAHADVRLARSTDQGGSWTTALVNTTDTASSDQIVAAVEADSLGGVDVIFWDRRLAPIGPRLWTWLARSLDGGQTFREFVVSDVGFNTQANELSGSFIGHYNSIDSSGDVLYPCWADSRPGTGSLDIYIERVPSGLFADVAQLSAATGGVVSFEIGPGPNLAGHGYLLLASASGSDPGFDLPGGVHVPLIWDTLTTHTLILANSPVFPSSNGTLDSQGSAVAQMDTLGSFDPGLAGIDLTFAVLFDTGGSFVHASGPAVVQLVP